MTTVIFTRRGIQYQKGEGSIRALFVPAHDQIVSYRDAGADPRQIAMRTGGGAGRRPLWRTERGEVKIYGDLPRVLEQTTKAVQVWLASDFAPADADAFFFVFEKSIIIHGVKHRDDEGQETWRATLLPVQGENVADTVSGYVGDLLVDGARQNICVAIDGALSEHALFKEALNVYGIVPQPFTMLKPASRTMPLYKHGDFTLLITLTLATVALCLGGLMFWWISERNEVFHARDKVADLTRRIAYVQANQKLGYIENPQEIVNKLARNFTQQPSAFLDAAARFGSLFGDLSKVSFQNSNNGTEVQDGSFLQTAEEGQKVVMVETSSLNQSLLADQEKIARTHLPQAPWVRQIASVGQPGEMGKFQILLQIDENPNAPLGPRPEMPFVSSTATISPASVISASGIISPSQETSSSTEVRP